MRLHLQYRLWIAAMNSDIDVLRICNDYLVWLQENYKDPDVQANIDHYKNEFSGLREELDTLRHDLHLVKMKLGAMSKEQIASGENIEETTDHNALRERYKAYRTRFKKIKKEFKQFEPEG